MDIIDRIFANHYDYYGSLGVETVKQQSAQYRQVEDAYQGRVVYELLQNAIDKAQSMIRVDLLTLESGNYLIVANDGTQFTFGSDYNYRDGNSQRCDFQSLCSIATSTKTSLKDIGNKGVGFKSVFSLNDWAEVYTRGRIQPGDISADVDFKLCNLFQTAESLSFVDVGSAAMLEAIHAENVRWGIPGYYFPMRIHSRPEFIERYFALGFVTVVCVPVSADKLDIVRDKILALRNYHFHFIPAKASFRHKRISLATGGNGMKDYEFKIEWSARVVSRPISDSTLALGRKAGIEVDEDAMAAVYFRPRDSHSSHACLYNYLPTEMQSIFANIDINADFHTSVDRRHIMLDKTEPIGRYNRALLVECLRLVKDALADSEALQDGVFEWPHAAFSDVQGYSDIIKEVFFDDFPTYARRVFIERMEASNRDDYDIFYVQFLFKGLDKCHIYNTSWRNDMSAKAGELMRKSGIAFLPDTPCASDNIFYRRELANIPMPESIPVEFTSYSADHWRWRDFSRAAGIKDFENTNEIYSLYWQCAYDGYVGGREDALDENAQIDMLASVAALMDLEKEGCPDCAAWRFHTVYKDSDTDTRARAAFALATLFYKTKDGRYRPGQLLQKSDIDKDFLSALSSRIGVGKINALLLKTGVSLNKYAYADARICNTLSDGLDYIPPVGIKDRLSREALWTNARIITASASLHPITVNQNYSFFNRLLRNEYNKQDFNALHVGNYAAMPKYFDAILSEHLSREAADKSKWPDMLRFYTKFHMPLLARHIALIKKGERLIAGSDKDELCVVSHEKLLDKDMSLTTPLLFVPLSKSYLHSPLKERYKQVEIFINDSNPLADSSFQSDMAEAFLSDTDKQADALVKIMQSRLTDSDFEDEDIRQKYYRKFENKRLAFHDTLSAYGVIGNERFEIKNTPYLIQNDTIHIKVDEDEALTRSNIARAFSDLAFDSKKFADIFELVVFSSCHVSDEERISVMPVAEDATLTVENESGPENKAANPPAKPAPALPDLSKFTIFELLENGEWKKSDFSLNGFSKPDGKGSSITPSMKDTGKIGEALMAKYFAHAFAKDYPGSESQAQAIAAINVRLKYIGLPPISVDNGDYSLNNIANALWYTKGGTKPFDIVTISKGKVRFIEVKSTKGNNTLYFSRREIIFANALKDSYEVYLCDISRLAIRPLGNILLNYAIHENDNCRIVPSGLAVIMKR